MPVLLVPRGAEERAVRQAVPSATIVAIAAGAGAAHLPVFDAGDVAIVLGLCGSLGAQRVGTAVIYASVADDGAAFGLDEMGIQRMRALLPAAPVVAAVTADHVVTRATERAALAQRFGAAAVDMEGTHLARALAARGVPFAMVRVVSDDPRADLPPIEDAFDAAGGIRPLQLAAGFARDPVAAIRFVRDVRRALAALGATARALTAAG